MCGLRKVTLREPYPDSRPKMRGTVTGGADAPVRACDVRFGSADRPQFRLKTIQESALAGAFGQTVLKQGIEIRDGQGRPMDGSSSPTVAALRAKCADGPAVFIAEDRDPNSKHTFVRQIFASYVEAEAERLDCEPLHFRMATRM
ncbi:hypothetical protein ACFW9D_16100 [Streptomyces sp. NPDC059524]|uniref:hypothetical protein n=1 Tax=Streptomyces sp. NPDC059524 TaxID=3346856 RepID=UPI00369E9939